MNGKEERNDDRLSVIANLIALQICQDKNLVDASWLLRRAGMKNADIGRVLDISEKSVSAHISNKKKQIEESSKIAEGRRKAHE